MAAANGPSCRIRSLTFPIQRPTYVYVPSRPRSCSCGTHQITLKRGVEYKRCAAGVAPTRSAPCEPVAAYSASDAEDGDLTSLVTFCPTYPNNDDCSRTQCRNHL
jgi:hypothetical protein